MKKRLFMLLLSISLVASSMPVNTYAYDAFIGIDVEEETWDEEEDPEDEYDGISFKSSIEEIKMPETTVSENTVSETEEDMKEPEETEETSEEPEDESEEKTDDKQEETQDKTDDEVIEVEEDTKDSFVIAGTPEIIERNGLASYLKDKGIVNGTQRDTASYGNPEADKTTSYPEKYDPRSANKVSGVRTQVGGTCWLYAAIAAAESNLIHKGLATKTIDLSELQTVYFIKYAHLDPLGYYTANTGDNYKGSNLTEFMSGGQVHRVIHLLSAWAAPVYETEAPFYPEKEYEISSGTYVDVTPTTEEINSWVLDESLTDKEYFHFKGSKSCDYDVNDTSTWDDVKYLVTNYGGVAASYYDDGTRYRTVEEGGEASYYYPYNVSNVSHAIEIIGWDDNYPKENFLSQPKANGAWLCKNSWGEVLDCNYVKSNGYFWLSYYEREITNIFAIEMDSAETYDNIYAHDGCNSVTSNGELSRKASLNIYTAKAYGEGTVEKVDGVMTWLTCDSPYKLTLYANPVVENGKLVSWSGKTKTFTGTSDYAGYYTIDISEDPLYVPYGSTYGIFMETEKDTATGTGTHGSKLSAGLCYTGPSRDELADCNESNKWTSCLRGLTNKATNITLSSSLSLNKESISLTDKETATLTAEILPSTTSLKKASFHSSDEKVAVVDENGLVTPKGPGSCTITAISYDGKSTDTCSVTVKTSSFTLSDTSVTTGNEITLTPVYTDGYTGETNEKITWSVEDKEIAKISKSGVLTGLEKGTVTVNAYITENPSVKASCKVTVRQLAENVAFDVEDGMVFLTVGQKKEVKAEILPEDAEKAEIEYTVDNISGYEVVRYENGVLSAIAEGDATLTAKIADSDISETINVVVYDGATALAPGFPAEQTLSMKAGESNIIAFWATASNTITYDEVMSATSSDTSVLQVTKQPYIVYNGGNVACDIKALKSGTATLTIKSNDNYGETLTYTITVTGGTDSGSGTGSSTPQPQKVDKIVAKNVTYKVKGKYLTIESVDLSKNATKCVLYSTITYKGVTYEVTSIGKGAFKGKTKLKSITLPSTLKTIEDSAFSGCKNLTSIKIPSRVTKIGAKAFYNCKSLKKVTLSTKLKTIGKSAFQNCVKLSKVTIPKNVTTIGTKAFYKCKSLKSITIKSKKVKSVGSSAFKSIKKRATIKVPKSKLKKYKNLLKKKVRSGTKIK